jgi:hypothetical protein
VSGLSDVVFATTPAGYSAAQYGPFLSRVEPLAEKFQLLENLGYLSRVGTASVDVVSDFELAVSQGSTAARLKRIDAESGDSGFLPLV